MFEFIPYIMTAVSIVGTVANSFGKRWCFYVWAVTNTFWICYNVAIGTYAQALLYTFNLTTCVIGLYKWKGKGRK